MSPRPTSDDPGRPDGTDPARGTPGTPGHEADPAPTGPTGRGTAPLKVVLGVVGLEVLALVVGAAALVVALVAGEVTSALGDLVLVLLLLLFAWLLAACGRALWQGRRWGRAPVVTWQLLQGFAALTLWQQTRNAGALVVVAVSLVVVVLMLTPAVVARTGAIAPRRPGGLA